jgi:hypothetical protein
MTDPIDALEGLPLESPPRDALLASLRLFRYRALTVITVITIVVAGLTFVALATSRQVDAQTPGIVSDTAVEFLPATGTTLIGSIQVTVTEVAISPTESAARLLFVDTGSPGPETDIEIREIRQGSTMNQQPISVPSIGIRSERTSTAMWIPLDPAADPFGAVIEVFVLPIPQSILDEGGELNSDDGFTGFVTIERLVSP